jgi:hypothetical protein
MSKEEEYPKAELEKVQRRTAKRRTALVMSIIKGETSPQDRSEAWADCRGGQGVERAIPCWRGECSPLPPARRS